MHFATNEESRNDSRTTCTEHKRDIHPKDIKGSIHIQHIFNIWKSASGCLYIVSCI